MYVTLVFRRLHGQQIKLNCSSKVMLHTIRATLRLTVSEFLNKNFEAGNNLFTRCQACLRVEDHFQRLM